MERLDLIIKSVVGVIAGFFSILTGIFGIPFVALLILMAIDFITALMAAKYTGEGLNSKKGYKGLFKKTYTILLIGAVAMTEISLLQSNGIVADGIAGAFVVIELVSVVENGGKMGIKFPDKFKDFITQLKNGKTENNNEKK
ncbi:holin [Paenibacillaceae bacterium]|nr:holin [Paenibacillaceae bacterium]